MGRLLALTGIIVTALYTIFAWWLIGDRIQSLQMMPLNEVGDFLAGAFGPLAILWLVLGFFQQGIELRQGTEALLMQAKELKSSVEQQTELVEVSRRQLEADIAAASRIVEQAERDAEPHIDLYYKDRVYSAGKGHARFFVSNSGPKCDFLKVLLRRSDGYAVQLMASDIFGEGKEKIFMIPFDELSVDSAVEIILSCVKRTGSESKQYFEVLKVEPDGNEHYAKVSKVVRTN